MPPHPLPAPPPMLNTNIDVQLSTINGSFFLIYIYIYILGRAICVINPDCLITRFDFFIYDFSGGYYPGPLESSCFAFAVYEDCTFKPL